ncbi:MSC2 [Candida margitis]|uniref:MSC2 n=1 Tax=Candida margitis TaxID=1775924 RepID=UPI0022270108|nr:MSC2 [Candida margitis]KAI5970323.1 MSC2 [Candida margitis]
MEQTEVPYIYNNDTPSPYSKLTPRINLTSSISSTKSTIGSLLSTSLPLLIAYPIVFISQGLILTPTTSTTANQGSNYVPSILSRIAVSIASSSAILLIVHFAQWIKVIIPRDDSTSSRSEASFLTAKTTNSIKIYLAIACGLLSTLCLPFDRCSLIAFGLYLNLFNVYTPLMLLLDLLIMSPSSAYSDNEPGPKTMVILGYGLISVAFTILHRDTKFQLPLDRNVTIMTTLLGVLIWLVLSNQISFSMIGVNLITFTISLVTFQEFPRNNNGDDKLQVQVLFFMGLSSVNTVLKYLVFQSFSVWSCIGDLLLTLLIIPGLKSSQRFGSYQDGHNSNATTTTASSLSSSSSPSSSSILSQVVKHQDTRAIFNFLLLNASFMIIQFLYSFRSKSLGLLSDSLHMLLDCLSLALGLIAGVLSKREIDNESNFPLGWFHLENLAGFTNATLLIGISGSIMFEAVGRLINPVHLQRTNELIVVSVLGLLVNLVGVFAFNHGHTHGHSHGHSHSHAGGSHVDSHSHSHSHSHSPASHTPESNEPVNDNMRGIFLHILADALGSVGVVISTILTNLFHWQGFDPIASFIIAILILASAIPLIKSTASSLLLQIPRQQESTIRNTLHEISNIKGVKSITTPRFWPSGGNKINGYVHVQIYRGENSWYIKKQIERLFSDGGGNDNFSNDVMIQVENDYDDCWCRKVK